MKLTDKRRHARCRSRAIPGKTIPLLLAGFLVFTSLSGCSVHVRGNVDTSGDPLRVSVTTQNGDEVTQTTRVFGMTEDGLVERKTPEMLAASVVRLEIYDDKDSRIATGTGFAFGDPVKIATSAHVIVNMAYAVVTRDDGSTFKITDKAVFADTDLDIAALPLPEGEEFEPLPLAKDPPERGSEVTAIGSQAGLVNLVTIGNMSGTWENDGTTYMIFTAPVSSGNSGGPLFDEYGNVVGIVIGTYDKAQNLNIALSAKYLSEEAL